MGTVFSAHHLFHPSLHQPPLTHLLHHQCVIWGQESVSWFVCVAPFFPLLICFLNSTYEWTYGVCLYLTDLIVLALYSLTPSMSL